MVSFETIVQDYGTYVYNQALKLTCNLQDAEDLAQETLIKAWQHHRELKEDHALASWLRTICLNEFRMKLRKDGRMALEFHGDLELLEQEGRALLAELPSPELETEVSEAVSRMRDGCFLAMSGKLTVNQRVVFSLVDMFGLSVEEAAKLLELSPKAVKGLLYRARVSLESFFRGHCYFLDHANPCSCESWIAFMGNRDANQKKTRKLLTVLECKDKDFKPDPKAVSTILGYYSRMPERRPEDGWFDRVIAMIGDAVIENKT